MQAKLALLQNELHSLEAEASQLAYSLERCKASDSLIQIRELRNLIAHEYAAESMAEIYAAIQALAPNLLLTVPKVVTDGYALLNRYRDPK